MYATKIKMKNGCRNSNNVKEIDEIYVEGCTEPGFYKKSKLYDYLIKNPSNSIKVKIYPYPDLVPVLSALNEKYVRSEPNDTDQDNLLKLPRE